MNIFISSGFGWIVAAPVSVIFPTQFLCWLVGYIVLLLLIADRNCFFLLHLVCVSWSFAENHWLQTSSQLLYNFSIHKTSNAIYAMVRALSIMYANPLRRCNISMKLYVYNATVHWKCFVESIQRHFTREKIKPLC